MIDRIHLRIMQKIKEKGSLTGAAQSLNLTQSAVSHTMKKLELMIGTPLWVKEGRHLRLTQAGQFLQNSAVRLNPQLDYIDARLSEYATGERATLKIGMECYPCYQWLKNIVKPYLMDCPDIDIDIKQRFQFGGLGALLNYDVDILVTPDPIMRDGIDFYPVLNYELVLVLHEDHPYAEQDYVTPADIADETLYTYPVEKDRLDVYQYFFMPAALRPKRQKIFEDTEMMLQHVLTKRGVTTLPLWLVEDYKKQMPIQAVRLNEEGIFKTLFLGIRQQDMNEKYVDKFISYAKRHSSDFETVKV